MTNLIFIINNNNNNNNNSLPYFLFLFLCVLSRFLYSCLCCNWPFGSYVSTLIEKLIIMRMLSIRQFSHVLLGHLSKVLMVPQKIGVFQLQAK
jgi:hypothetical protein